ncbi:hypothetical protein L1987_06853 [Smallanthus sonchifolius]|uniref:Uncharacterized protein n=1 Tax=Smallanthus sonchifolius TaxID=185202 RepID=A0ACB9JZG7_9ASTR|nr:hypothetical protein L1987_06853 [Smallanthus sonchifolius]
MHIRNGYDWDWYPSLLRNWVRQEQDVAGEITTMLRNEKRLDMRIDSVVEELTATDHVHKKLADNVDILKERLDALEAEVVESWARIVQLETQLEAALEPAEVPDFEPEDEPEEVEDEDAESVISSAGSGV